MKLKRLFPISFFILLVAIFFVPVIFGGKIALPADTIVGLYHPFRDFYANEYPRGIPYKNFLITDPVRQQYPWKELAVDVAKQGMLPLWNPYTFSGTPHLATMQSGFFSPFTLLFLFLSNVMAWNLQIILQTLIGGIFMYLYVRNLRIHPLAAVLSAIAFSFSGFSIAWLEWGTIGQTALWLPFILLCVDKIFGYSQLDNSKFKIQNLKFQFKSKMQILWLLLYVFSLAAAFFAGHLQIFFYMYLVCSAYFFARWIQLGKSKKILLLFLILNSCFLILTSIQWIPTLQFINLSARSIDQANWQQAGWFIPWEHLIQFVAPDFFGNPATLNYWGVWNYGELVGYIGIVPLIFAIAALLYRRDKETIFFGSLLIFALIFALPTFMAKLPFMFEIPFLSTAQPTRLLFLVDFSLCLLAAFGLDSFIKSKKKFIYPFAIVGIIFVGLWFIVLFSGGTLKWLSNENIRIAKNNLLFPSAIFSVSIAIYFLMYLSKTKMMQTILVCSLIVITAGDLFRFGSKFTPFTNQEYLFPSTKTTTFLQNNLGNQRMMSIDSRIFPPNFSSIYKLQTVEGYDPLYLQRYGELIAASERGKPDISPPFGFNRIITPHNFDSKIIDLLGVKYIVSLSEISSPKFTKVFEEGETKVYENHGVLPRVFFAEQTYYVANKQEAIEALFQDTFDLQKIAIFELAEVNHEDQKKMRPPLGMLSAKYAVGQAKILTYEENQITIEVDNPAESGVLILTDAYYPTWKAKIDGDHDVTILLVDYAFRGISVPKGHHVITFYNSLF